MKDRDSLAELNFFYDPQLRKLIFSIRSYENFFGVPVTDKWPFLPILADVFDIVGAMEKMFAVERKAKLLVRYLTHRTTGMKLVLHSQMRPTSRCVDDMRSMVDKPTHLSLRGVLHYFTSKKLTNQCHTARK